jgi:hypothetical protein
MPEPWAAVSAEAILDRDVESFPKAQALTHEPCAECATFDIFHRDVVLTLSRLAQRMDGADIWVAES